MPGDLRSKERAIVTLTSTGASLTNGSAGGAATDLDARTAGNFATDLQAQFELTCQWGTITGIVKDTVVADLYLIPELDGTNLPDMDLTAGASALPPSTFVGSFVATKAPTASTNARFITGNILLNPLLYTVYILNRSGMTISANWSLKAVGVQGQYT